MPDTTASNAAHKIALITGANKGIGFQAAKELAAAGCTVLLGARQAGAGQQAADELRAQKLNVELIEIDLNRPETITAAAESMDRRFGRLDILINNAGIVDQGDGPPSTASLDAVERIFHTNFFGTLRVTKAMLPLLRKSTGARIVNVSSGLGSLTQAADPDWPYGNILSIGYCASKSALNMLTVKLARELKDTQIKVNSADPGYTATDLNQHRGTQTVEEGTAEVVRLALLPEDGPTGTFSDAAGPVAW